MDLSKILISISIKCYFALQFTQQIIKYKYNKQINFSLSFLYIWIYDLEF